MPCVLMWTCEMHYWTLWDALLDYLNPIVWLLHERTVVGTGFLAQASMSRLSEIYKGSPKVFYVSSRWGDQLYFWASKHLT